MNLFRKKIFLLPLFVLVFFFAHAHLTHAGILDFLLRPLAQAAPTAILDFSFAVVGKMLASLAYFVLWTISFVVGIAGFFFNVVFDITVIHFKDFVTTTDVITKGWTIIRDMSNIFFIFILLWLAISTILQLDEHGVKHALSKLIVAAVLINFSLLFTQSIIDFSNILTKKVYDAAISNKTDFSQGRFTGGLGDRFLSMFKLQKSGDLFFIGNTIVNSIKETGQAQDKTPFLEANLQANPISTMFMGIIIMNITIFVFLAVCIIFLKRFVVLILLMIFSPLAFLAMAMPGHSMEHTAKEKFWDPLIKECLYAPMFMLLIYITLLIGDSLSTTKALSFNDPSQILLSVVPVGNVIGYSVVIIMLVASLIISETIGVSGAGTAIAAFNGMRSKFAGWVGSNTLGRMSYNWINKGQGGTSFRLAGGGLGNSGTGIQSKFANFLSKSTFGRKVAQTISHGADTLGNAGFGGNSYKSMVDAEEHAIEEALHENHMSDDDLAKLFLEGSKLKPGKRRNAIDRIFDKTDATRLASAGLRMQDPDMTTAFGADDRYFQSSHGHARLSGDKALEVQKKQSGSILAYHRDRFKRLALDTDSHGHAKTQTQIQRDWQTISDDFKKYTDKQRTELLSTLEKEGQELLSIPKDTSHPHVEKDEIKDQFRKLVGDTIKTFKQAEMAYNSSTITDPMKDVLNEFAFAGRTRAEMVGAFDKNGGDATKAFHDPTKAITQFRDALKKIDHFQHVPNIDTMSFQQLVAEYRKYGKISNDDITYVKAKENMTRALTETNAYSEASKNIK